MKIRPDDDVFERARLAHRKALRDGKLPQSWAFGRTVWSRVRHVGSNPGVTLYGLPFVVKDDAPHDLLELDVF